MKYVPRGDTAPAGIDHLVRIFKAYDTVTTSTTVRGSWSKAGSEYITLLKKIIPIVPSKLVFNFDEKQLSDWEDRKIKPVLVPAAEEDSTLHYPVNRNSWHHTLMCCVNAAGHAYCLMLITPNAEAAQIFDTGARDHIDLALEI
jgi:hypothetical protein